MEQFGFSIYGHANASSCGCCSTKPTQSMSISASSFGLGIHRLSAIPHLPQSEIALQMLQQLQEEFEPVVRDRGWKVLQLTEMCCCGDGDEALPIQTSNASAPKPATVAGYCVSSNDGRLAQGIHIRLRRSCGTQAAASFYDSHELRLIMAHELAHIQIGPHNDAFYRLMKELLAEREEFLAADMALPSFPLTAGRRVGGSGDLLGSIELRQRTARAAICRQRQAKNDTDTSSPHQR